VDINNKLLMTLRSSREVEIPMYLQQRPKDARGYVIPYLVMIRPDGTPDFRVTDMDKWLDCYQRKACALCGVEMMGHYVYFIGGPLSVEGSLLFTDPPMHESCARYALKVCPFLAAPRAKYRSLTESCGNGLGLGDGNAPRQVWAAQG
jgi:hypothetical protein